MSRSKKIFIAILIAFFIGLVALAIDISRKTSFPGTRKSQKQAMGPESIQGQSPSERNLSPKSATYPL